ncbi:DNA polymerase Y family protein [Cereibacter sphaeroides]|uniref:Y-family DNA polymerase n=1 Tax=Cereibacter sphaeroides TaxID=1063 RepID=UPI001F16F3F4|nr:DNA polymerase Y family protein [Cereibacter sphaeroides]MCE6952450.1 DNA polymerase Y family protein [Cereibacter sphaeroides]
MAQRRILSLWFPRLGVERVLRRRNDALPPPLAVVGERGGAQVLTSVSAEAEALGLGPGLPLRDATAICPVLETCAEDAAAEAAFLTVLRRWAGKFSPWIAEEPPAGLTVDLTGCAHLFGGEAALLGVVEADCAALGLSVRAAIADTPGAAWALARHAGREASAARSGDAIEQEAHATRSRAAKRRMLPPPPGGTLGMIAASGHMRQALGPLPVAALRLPDETVLGLTRLGLRRVADLMDLPRAALARRFGLEVLRRLDQALGLEPEPVSPARAPLHFAVRLTLPEPIGLLSDVEAGLDRLLPPLCARLKERGRGARRVRLQAFRTDGQVPTVDVGLARPADSADRIRPLLALKLPGIDAGFGIDTLRLSAVETEPMLARPHRGPAEAAGRADALGDLIGRLGARLGMEAVTRLHPAESHIPAKSALILTAAWSEPAGPWPEPSAPRPLVLFPPEPVEADGSPPTRLRWRRRERRVLRAEGPERILPEWWLDDPDWRSGPRDYWRLELDEGERVWMFEAMGGLLSGGWWFEGEMA